MRYLIRWCLGEIIPAKTKSSQRKDPERVLGTLGSQPGWSEISEGRSSQEMESGLYWGWMTLWGRVDACKLLGSYSEWNWKPQQVINSPWWWTGNPGHLMDGLRILMRNPCLTQFRCRLGPPWFCVLVTFPCWRQAFYIWPLLRTLVTLYLF